MLNNLFQDVKILFAPAAQRQEYEAKKFAEQTKTRFETLEGVIKTGEYVMQDHQKITQDREQFLRDNADTQVDQNVNRNTDNKRANYLLAGVMLIGTIFSVKGLQFFFGSFYAAVSLWVIIPIAMFLAMVLVMGSIYFNQFAERYRGVNLLVYIHAKAAAYIIVLFLPVVNLIEGFNSHYDQTVMALNIFACIVDVAAHTALVSMSNTFITAENSRKAIKILHDKDKAQRKADISLRSLNGEFTGAKNGFTNVATKFVHAYKQLEAENAEAARRVMFMLSNFLIWMINNKVMQHAILPYHANENGQPVVELNYFTPENDAIRRGWDQLSAVNGYTSTPQNLEIPEVNPQPQVLTNGNGQQNQEQNNGDTNNGNPEQRNTQQENNQEQPQDYATVLDDTNPNPNDKSL